VAGAVTQQQPQVVDQAVVVEQGLPVAREHQDKVTRVARARLMVRAVVAERGLLVLMLLETQAALAVLVYR
jgi:hypothetical protein